MEKVKVIRQIGKHGEQKEVTGVIVRYSETIRIEGEKTALVKYDDNDEEYWHKVSKIKFI